MLSLSTSGMSGPIMDLRSVSHGCISSWWRMTQIPVRCASVGSEYTLHIRHYSLHAVIFFQNDQNWTPTTDQPFLGPFSTLTCCIHSVGVVLSPLRYG